MVRPTYPEHPICSGHGRASLQPGRDLFSTLTRGRPQTVPDLGQTVDPVAPHPLLWHDLPTSAALTRVGCLSRRLYPGEVSHPELGFAAHCWLPAYVRACSPHCYSLRPPQRPGRRLQRRVRVPLLGLAWCAAPCPVRRTRQAHAAAAAADARSAGNSGPTVSRGARARALPRQPLPTRGTRAPSTRQMPAAPRAPVRDVRPTANHRQPECHPYLQSQAAPRYRPHVTAPHVPPQPVT